MLGREELITYESYELHNQKTGNFQTGVVLLKYEVDKVMDAMEECFKELGEVISKMETTTPKWISVKDRLPKEDEFVLGDDPEGSFYCPYCFHCDPTYPESKFFKVDNPRYSIKEFLIYVIYRAFSIATTPVRCIYAKYTKYQLDKWIERSRE